MQYQITKTGASRLGEILQRDRIGDPQRVCEILKSEIEPVIESYVSLSSPIKVRCRQFENKVMFFIEVDAMDIRKTRYLP